MARSITAALNRRRVAWLAPVVVGGLVVAGTVVASSGATAAPRLAPRTTAQLLTAVAKTSTTALSGTVTETANFGLPDLPGGASAASLSWQSFLTGTHSVRVWVDGPRKQRLAVIGQLSEADIVHNGRDFWTYSSESNTVSHRVLPARSRDHDSQVRQLPMMTPAAATARILRSISPSTRVSLGAARTVAGRSAYTLVIAPRDHRSTIREITLAIDSARFVPLQVEVFGASSTPAIKVGFSDVSFGRPAASTFDFHAPAGATVVKNPFTGNRGRRVGPADARWRAPHVAVRPRVIGSGWTAVLEVHNATMLGAASGLLGQLSNPVGASGLRLLHTALVNAVVTADGRAFVGAVRPAALEHIAATTSG